MSFAEAVRQELAGNTVHDLASALSGVCDTAPVADSIVRIRTRSPATARWAMKLLDQAELARGVQSVVRGRVGQVGKPRDAGSYLVAAFLVAGSVSDPRAAPHFEIRTLTAAGAEQVAGQLRALVGFTASISRHRDRFRAVAKSGEVTGEIIAALGATRAFLRYDDLRLRRDVRRSVNRAANADAANLERRVAAAGIQVTAIERMVEEAGWDVLDREEREVALARIANPSASLGDIAELTGLSKSAVQRRLAKLVGH